jgi:hypothetical protein
MGNLSNLFISQSFISVLHTGNDNTLSAQLVDIQDGLGNSSGVSLNTNGDLSMSGSLTASLQQGYVWVGNNNGRTTTVPTSSFGGTLPSGVVSGSSQIILQQTTGDLSGSRIDGAVALATNSTYADNTIVYGKNLHSTTIPKGTPLYFTGSGTAGNIVGILPADAGNPLRMPAGGIAGESILVGEEGIVILDGFINEVDTTPFASGDEVFVGVGGGYTNVPPTGSNNLIQFLGYVERSAVNGSGVIQMSGEARTLPNIQEGYAWVGDVNDVPQAIPTSSFGGGGSINTGSFATTGSNTFIGNQTITGSLFVSSSDVSVIFSPTGFNAQGLVVSGNLNVQQPGELYSNIIRGGGLFCNEIKPSSGNTTTFKSTNMVIENDFPGNPSFLFVSGSTITSGSMVLTGSFDHFGSQNITGSVGISQVLNLKGQDPLPSGTIGDLAVSGSSLFFYNGAWTLVV